MTDDERAARRWVEHASISLDPNIKELGHALQRLLDRPVMPRSNEVQGDVLHRMLNAHLTAGCGAHGMEAAIDALHAHLTAPPPKKKVEAWGVVLPMDLAVCNTLEDAKKFQRSNGGRLVRLVEAADADK